MVITWEGEDRRSERRFDGLAARHSFESVPRYARFRELSPNGFDGVSASKVWYNKCNQNHTRNGSAVCQILESSKVK